MTKLTQQQLKRQTIQDVCMDIDDLEGQTLGEIVEKYGADCKFEITPGYYGEETPGYYIVHFREEDDEEYNSRIDQLKATIEMIENNKATEKERKLKFEKSEYLRLKKKFGDK